MESYALLKTLAGLGIFFVGINLLSEHLKESGKPYVKSIIKLFAVSDLRAIFSGALAGAVTNSGKAVTFSLIGLVTSGVLSSRRCLPIIIGGSLGSSLLVLWVSIDFKSFQLLLLAVAGLCYQFLNMKKPQVKFIAGLAFGLGMVLFGLDMLQAGAASLKDNPAFLNFLSSTHDYWLVAFVLGAIGAFVTQSGSTISLVAISFLTAGLLDVNQTIMFIYGANVGSGFSTAALGLGMKGSSRQLVMFHAVVKIAGSLILAPWLYLETYFHVPGIKYLASLISSNLGTQVGLIYVGYEVISALLLLVLLNPASMVLARLWQPSREESLSKLAYIGDTFDDADEAAVGIANEQARVLQRLRNYFDSFRTSIPADKRIPYDILHESNKTVQSEIQSKIAVQFKQKLTVDQTEDIFRLHATQKWLTALDKDLFSFIELLLKSRNVEISNTLLTEMLTSLDLLLHTANSAIQARNDTVANSLAHMTSQTKKLASWFKPETQKKGGGGGLQGRKAILEIIMAYERIVWTINQLAHTLLQHSNSIQPLPLQSREPKIVFRSKPVHMVTPG